MTKKYDDLGEKIKKLRVLNKFSQEELGKVLNIPKQSVSRIEKGNRTVTQEELEKISEFFSVPIQFIMKDGWIEKKFKLPYDIENKWGIEVPKFLDDYIVEVYQYSDVLLETENISGYRYTIEEIQNSIKAFKLLLKELKEKSK